MEKKCEYCGCYGGIHKNDCYFIIKYCGMEEQEREYWNWYFIEATSTNSNLFNL